LTRSRKAKVNVAQYLIARLSEVGVRHLFAVPGDYASPFLEAVDATTDIACIATVTELGCGYAADGYARISGIGAACIQYGVGTLSVLNCAAGAFVERVAVAFISAGPSTKDRALARSKNILFHHSTGDLEVNRKMFEHVTVAAEIVSDAASAPAQIDRAILALLTRHRPIYIEVLQDVWTTDCAPIDKTLAPEAERSDPKSLVAFVDLAWAAIKGSLNPIIWAGVEVQRYGLQEALQHVIDASGFPFTTTSLGKTVLDERQRQFIGTYAGPASPRMTREAMAAADCILVFGAIITDDYLDIMAESFSRMIVVSDSEARVGDASFRNVTMPDALKCLLTRLRSDSSFPRSCEAADSPEPEDDPSCPHLSYNKLLRELCSFLTRSNRLDEVALILGESTSLYVFGNLFGLERDCFVAQAAWGSLGHETGCALGVALGSGKRPFVIAGDGGFMMTCQELSTLARKGVNAAIFVLSNECYAIEQAFVDVRGFSPEGTFAPFDLLPRWDYLSLAKALGARGFRVDTLGSLTDTLEKIAELRDVPALIEVVIPQKDLPPQLARLAGAPAPCRRYRR
jgi:indolepyruvate decarboxylase